MSSAVSAKKPAVFWRAIISFIGLFLIVNAVLNILLFTFGDITAARIEKRRFGGSNDAYPASSRYEWSVMYEFTDDDGNQHTGYTRRRGSDLSVHVENEVRYFSFAPSIHALRDEAVLSLGQFVAAGIGCFLVYVVNWNLNKKWS
jgi:hypothetical protein